MIYFVRKVANIYFTLFVYSNKHLMQLIFTIKTKTNNVLKTPKLLFSKSFRQNVKQYIM